MSTEVRTSSSTRLRGRGGRRIAFSSSANLRLIRGAAARDRNEGCSIDGQRGTERADTARRRGGGAAQPTQAAQRNQRCHGRRAQGDVGRPGRRSLGQGCGDNRGGAWV